MGIIHGINMNEDMHMKRIDSNDKLSWMKAVTLSGIVLSVMGTQ